MKRLVGFLAFIYMLQLVLNAPYDILSVASPYDSMLLRIGLKEYNENKSKVTLANKSLLFGYVMDNQFVSETQFNSQSGFVIAPFTSYFLVSDEVFTTADDARNKVKAAKSAGYKAVLMAYSFQQWKVAIIEFTSQDIATAAIAQANSDTLLHFGLVSDNQYRTQMTGDEGVVLFDNTLLQGAFAGNDGVDSIPLIKIGDRKYRGVMEIGRYGLNDITAVNVVDLEFYLYSVTPSEMPRSFPIEALKAQSIAARSYAVYYTQYVTKYKNEPYQLCDTVNSQVYKGYTQEYNETTNAVNATMGQVMSYNDQVIECLFFSTSGGRTEASENVWSGSKPYYISKPDITELDPAKDPWTKIITSSDLKTLLKGKDVNIGDITNVEVVNYSDSGRAMSLEIKGTNGTYLLEKETMRYWLSLASRKFKVISGNNSTYTSVNVLNATGTVSKVDLGSLYVLTGNADLDPISGIDQAQLISSTNFNNIPLLKGTANAFTFVGVGNGHGVGMSQSGAKGMALLGYDYIDILEYYYTGAHVR